MKVCAIDPGKRGAIVILDYDSENAYFERLKYNKDGILITDFSKFKGKIDRIIVEKIHGRGGWHASAVFKMGYYFGQLVHSLKDYPVEFVPPKVWTSEVHKKVVKVKGRNGAKEKSLRAYNLYFPHNPIKKYHDGVIDALLICVHEKIKNKEKLRKWEFVSCLSLF